MRIALLSGALAFAAVVAWKWPAAPLETAGTKAISVLAAPEHRQAARVELRHSPQSTARALSAPIHPVRGLRHVVPVSSVRLARADIVPLIDESNEAVAWRLASAVDDQLDTGTVILAINGRGLSNGGAGELVRALEEEATVSVTLASQDQNALTEGPMSQSVGAQLVADSVTAPARDCRLDPARFRSAEDYRRAVYLVSRPENAPECTVPD